MRQTDTVQVDLHPSSGFVLPCIRGLKHQIGKMTSKYHSLFVKKLNSSLHSRMVPYEMNNTYSCSEESQENTDEPQEKKRFSLSLINKKALHKISIRMTKLKNTSRNKKKLNKTLTLSNIG